MSTNNSNGGGGGNGSGNGSGNGGDNNKKVKEEIKDNNNNKDNKKKKEDSNNKNNNNKTPNTKVLIQDAVSKAFGGGVAGASAMFVNVLALMWIRTIMNYQYRHGTTTTQAMQFLYKEGGVRRFYRGLGPALIQGPLARFGDTASNTGTLTFLNSHSSTKDLPIPIKSAIASGVAAGFRIFLMPVDAVKTALQVEGKQGINLLMTKLRTTKNPFIFWHGSLASVSATFVGHYPWFATYNFLNEKLPKYNQRQEPLKAYGRQAIMGFCASGISDTLSNSLRVIKTTRQTYTIPISYLGTAKLIIAQDGLKGLFGRGLKTRILGNGMQGLLFSVLWKYFEDVLYSDICQDCT